MSSWRTYAGCGAQTLRAPGCDRLLQRRRLGRLRRRTRARRVARARTDLQHRLARLGVDHRAVAERRAERRRAVPAGALAVARPGGHALDDADLDTVGELSELQPLDHRVGVCRPADGQADAVRRDLKGLTRVALELGRSSGGDDCLDPRPVALREVRRGVRADRGELDLGAVGFDVDLHVLQMQTGSAQFPAVAGDPLPQPAQLRLAVADLCRAHVIRVVCELLEHGELLRGAAGDTDQQIGLLRPRVLDRRAAVELGMPGEIARGGHAQPKPAPQLEVTDLPRRDREVVAAVVVPHAALAQQRLDVGEVVPEAELGTPGRVALKFEPVPSRPRSAPAAGPPAAGTAAPAPAPGRRE